MEEEFIRLLSKELVKSVGCTEPVLFTYGVALAKMQLNSEMIRNVQINASKNLLKNAMSVTIPGTTRYGTNFSSVLLASALGLLKHDVDKNMEILNDISKSDIENAKELISEGLIRIDLHKSKLKSKLFLEIIINSSTSTSRVIIENKHDNVTLIELNGEIIKEIVSCNENSEEIINSTEFNIDSIIDFVKSVNTSKLGLIKDSIKINKEICKEGLKHPYGLKVGKSVENNQSKGFFSNDITSKVVSYTAAGSDARMAGCTLPAMSNSGSGNQGISATIPVVIVGEELNKDTESIIRAVTLSNLIAIYIKTNLGRLSAICGASISAMGACCGITYLLGGEKKEIEESLQIMMANITGMICDGAKSGCALKIATCTYAAIQSALLAVDGTSISYKEGIIEKSPENTLENFCNLANQGMNKADALILEMMLNKT